MGIFEDFTHQGIVFDSFGTIQVTEKTRSRVIEGGEIGDEGGVGDGIVKGFLHHGCVGEPEEAAFGTVTNHLLALCRFVIEVGHAQGIGVDIDGGRVSPDGVGVEKNVGFGEAVPVDSGVIGHKVLDVPAPCAVIEFRDTGAVEEHAVKGGDDRVCEGIGGVDGISIAVI